MDSMAFKDQVLHRSIAKLKSDLFMQFNDGLSFKKESKHPKDVALITIAIIVVLPVYKVF